MNSRFKVLILRLTPYACVNKHWNGFFESITFKSLIILPKDIEFLATIVTPRRRCHLEHLWLRIPLSEYSIRHIVNGNQPDIYETLNWDFTKPIVALWDVISYWNEPRQKGMTLELTAECKRHTDPTGYQHVAYQKYLSSGQLEQYDAIEDVHETINKSHIAASESSFLASAELRNIYWTAIVNTNLGTKPLQFIDEQMSPVDEEWELPPVTAVSKFLIRRQQFFGNCPTALNTILSSLKGIEDIHIERWRYARSYTEKRWCRKAQNTLVRELPRSTKSLSLYGETNPVIHQWESKNVNIVSFAKAVRQYTNFLEHLSISHMVDAREFFRPFSSPDEEATSSLREWPNLKTLSLTSDVFKTGTEQEINSLLCTAARAARKMPKLEMLELWNGEAGVACVFCYRFEDTVGKITWCGTDVDTLAHEVINEWHAVSVCLNRTGVRAFVVPIEGEDVGSTGQVLEYLSSKDQIMHPVSAYTAIGKRKGKAEIERQGSR
ncbi:hypothetical protein NW768_002142 [Fusarium equiseti]|uniref:DUF6546 domain-containing protein n=1 Tax=Fusarium equiseti TaxID=61235 RepID=A0ABQ8RN03_FUSEQ|nr:hypothetical protein NW768_002142 [Fusarium equiseti]